MQADPSKMTDAELNAAVAERVMGWPLDCVTPNGNRVYLLPDGGWITVGVTDTPSTFNPATNIADAWLVVEKLRADGWLVVVKHMPNHGSYITGDSRSEYDAPSKPRLVFTGKALVECHHRPETFKSDGLRIWYVPTAIADTVPRAICEAALRAVDAMTEAAK